MAVRPPSVGLGGDGDEIDAIEDVERTLGIRLDISDAGNWHTAGDVFRSVVASMPASEHADPDLWARFATALCATTGVDPRRIEPASPLLSQTHLTLWPFTRRLR
ncbi:hypothetical protein TPR58_20580 [Sphingomonas sp. HF-S3]|uniref:Uncharacterized protein n=1 Tax=Sphingomonas rustica TaxID=3103142 RepID=A0ABV0BFG8_9SPHN